MFFKFDWKQTCLLILSALILTGCSGGGGGSDDSNPGSDVDEIEAQMRTILNSVSTDTDFTLLVKAPNGREFSHSVGSSTPTTVYRSASTSKWVSAAVILDLVKNGILALDDNPQDYITSWPTTINYAQIELWQLLSFTSGLTEEPFCLFPGQLIEMADCVDNVVSVNPNPVTPGTEFHYNSSHLQVAGLMAIRAAGVNSWGDLFNSFKMDTQLFPTGVYDLPGTINPRLAGGMHWTANEYLVFLEKLFNDEILTPELIDEMTSDQLVGVDIVSSPVGDGGEDWHYGFGNWIECHALVFDCVEVTKTSSPGAYGAYPFVDFEFGYFGILAREGNLGSFRNGYQVFLAVEIELQSWAELNQ